MSKSDHTKKLLQKLDTLDEKLETLINLVAITPNMENLRKKPQKEKIKILSKLGLSRNLVALLVGTTPLTVSVTLSQMKKKKKDKIKPTGSKQEEKVEQ